MAGVSLRSAAAGVTAAVAVLVGLVAPTPVAAVDAGDPARLTVTTLEPRALRADSTLVVAGTVAATGGELTDVRVRLRLGRVIDTRSALARDVERPRRGALVSGASIELDEPVEAGNATDFRVSVPVADLGLGSLGVYPLRVEAYGTADGERRTLASVVTYLPWFPDEVRRRVQLAWVLPLVSAPQRGPGGVFRSERLADELTGRLRSLVEAGGAAAGLEAPAGRCDPTEPGPAPDQPAAAPCPVRATWAVDPDLLETADVMAGGRYRVGRGGDTTAGRGEEAATEWLDEVRATLSGAPVLPLPYADVDAVALTRAGLTDVLGTAMDTGLEVLEKAVKGAAVAPDVGWPADGLVTDSARAALDAEGVGTLLLVESAIEREDDPVITPDARVLLRDEATDEEVPALVADEGLRALLAAGEPDGARLAEQRFLAETALVTAERPGGRAPTRTILVLPPRDWSPSIALAQAVVAAPGRVPWLAPGTVGELLRTDPEREVPTATLRYPDDGVDQELPGTHVTAVATETTRLRQLADALDDEGRLVEPALLAGLRADSAAWRPGREGLDPGRALRRSVRQTRIDLESKLHVQAAGQVVLGASGGVVPITVVNDLPTVASVRLVLDAGASAEIEAPAEPITIEARSRTQVNVRAEARTPGRFVIRATLLTPEGRRQIGPVHEVVARSTAYGRVAIGITGAAFGLLLVLTGLRITRRALRARRG